MLAKLLDKVYQKKKDNNWEFIYWAIDLHGTCLVNNYKEDIPQFIHPDVLPTLQLIASLPESKLIMWTSSHFPYVKKVNDFLIEQGVSFEYLNYNPEISNTENSDYTFKFYFDILLEDKAGFDPDNHWTLIRHWLLHRRNLYL